MRLFELITHTRTRNPTAMDPVERSEPEMFSMADKQPGTFSFIRNDDDDPHMVRKYNKTAYHSKQDGFVVYAEFVNKYKLWDSSVHFPRIYNTNDDPDRDGSRYDWQMEKLIEWRDISAKEFLALYNRYFIAPVSREDLPSQMLVDDIINELLEALHPKSDPADVVKDEGLLSALKSLKVIRDTAGFSEFDLHINNIMYRRTAVGLQLVFSDPFGFSPS